ncbi:MAG: hypothetical protein ABSB87_19670 [Terriglobales bacterium]|jgi:hypothetical protein
MSSDERKEVDFILVRTMTPREAVSLLLDRFPTVRDVVCPDEDYFEWPSIVYDSFGSIVVARSDDPAFVESVALFIDELAEIKGPLVGNLLSSTLLEVIAGDAQLARVFSRRISPRARSLLHEVERSFYHRDVPAEET